MDTTLELINAKAKKVNQQYKGIIMLRKPSIEEEQYRLDLAKEIIENVQGIDADVFDVAQEMVYLGVTQMRESGVKSTDIIQLVKNVANHIPKRNKH